MATSANNQSLARPSRSNLPNRSGRAVYLGASMGNKPTQNESTGLLVVVALLVLVMAVVLPVTAIMYMDMLAIRLMVKEELTKVVRERKAMQRERKEGEEK